MCAQASVPPIVLDPADVQPLLTEANVRIVDLCSTETYAKHHVPGAVHLGYAEIVRQAPPASGLIPHEATLRQIVGRLGINADTHVICYDEEGGGHAGRLVWTLHACGHPRASVIDGGIISWANEGYPLTQDVIAVAPTDYPVTITGDSLIEADDIIARLDDETLDLLDARSVQEFTGEVAYSARPGRIPGARHVEWTDAMDQSRNLRLKPRDALLALLRERGFDPAHEVAVYCQTHHRSSLSYVMLKHLGFERVRGYHGAWSDWGNRTDTPVETG